MLPKKETLTIEFKSDKSKVQNSDIFDAVVAFANTEGGDLYLGIEDSGEVTGVHKDHNDPTTLGAYIANNTLPPVSIRAEIIEDIHPVLKISVPKSYGGIVATISGKVQRRQIKADGTPENVPMYPSEFATRLSDLRMLDYSAMPVLECSIDDFDPLEIEHLRNVILAYNGERSLLDLPVEDLFKALGFVRDFNGQLIPTITGILMIGRVDAIKRYIPTHTSSFQVLSGTDVKVNDDICLPLLSTIDKINTYMEAWNPEQEIEMGLFRMSVPDFNKRAYREALVNAFSHRDYSKMGRVRVAISDEGLTIANPGGFIEGVSIKNLLTAEPHGRNPQLADALKRIGLAEKTGRGIDRIFEGSLIYGNPLPDYSNSTPVTVSLFIPRSKPDSQIAKLISNEQNRLGRPLSLNTLLVLNMLKDMPRSNISELAEATNLSEIITKTILDTSIECGIVEIYGSGRNRTYILSPKVYSTKSKRIGYVRQVDIDETRYPELIINLAKTNDFIARADVVQLLHVDDNKAYRLLKGLVSQGILEPINKGHYAKYRYRDNA
ncbi:MAG: putative DNA binding domain-containing protein [Lachnospiraceae bacterium]|nr:putative DNA binding domain-containing protein [Lachnospiraceae bacterium]